MTHHTQTHATFVLEREYPGPDRPCMDCLSKSVPPTA